MGIKRGTLEVGSIFRGSVVISKVYRGTTVIYELADGSFFEEIATIQVAGSPVTGVQFNNFTATKTDTLVMTAETINGGDVNVGIFVNNNLTSSAYWSQYLFSGGISFFGGRNNNSRCMVSMSASRTYATIEIKLTNNGEFTYQSDQIREAGTAGCAQQPNWGGYNVAITTITQLDVIAEATNGLGVGSIFRLFKISEGA